MHSELINEASGKMTKKGGLAKNAYVLKTIFLTLFSVKTYQGKILGY